MRFAIIWLLVITSMFEIVLPVRGQTAGELRAKYGSPMEAYEIRPHILMTVKYSEDGQVYEYVLEARHTSRDKVAGESLMSGKIVREVVDEIVPLSPRGQHQNSMVFGSGCNALGIESYENVVIQTFTTCPSAEGNRVASVTIRWTNRRPKK